MGNFLELMLSICHRSWMMVGPILDCVLIWQEKSLIVCHFLVIESRRSGQFELINYSLLLWASHHHHLQRQYDIWFLQSLLLLILLFPDSQSSPKDYPIDYRLLWPDKLAGGDDKVVVKSSLISPRGALRPFVSGVKPTRIHGHNQLPNIGLIVLVSLLLSIVHNSQWWTHPPLFGRCCCCCWWTYS